MPHGAAPERVLSWQPGTNIADVESSAREMKTSSPWNTVLSERLRYSWPGPSEACTGTCRPSHGHICSCGGSRDRPKPKHHDSPPHHAWSNFQSCCDCRAGTSLGLSLRCGTCTACRNPVGSPGHPTPQNLVRKIPSQDLRSSHDQIQPHSPSQQISSAGALSQDRVSEASHLTPAEELISAINKLNLKMERSNLNHRRNNDIMEENQSHGPSSHSPRDAALPTTKRDRAWNRLRQGLIGHSLQVQTPFGTKVVVYADWAASGRLLWQVERFMIQSVYPLYANVHTEVGTCATATGQRFEEARATVAHCVAAPHDEYAVVFTGSGMTGAAFKLAHLLGLARRPTVTDETLPMDQDLGTRPVVMYSIMEHHSNCLLWRELDCETVVIGEDCDGLPDMRQMELELRKHARAPLILGSFSAGSNVTGIAPDVHRVAALLHKHGAVAAFDYASAGSCKKVTCVPTRPQHGALDPSLDAVMLSPHKLVGGPGSCGVLIVRRSIVRTAEPQSPGGGTVSYVNATQHWFEDNIERREEAGTPDVLGAIRCALALQIHASLGPSGTHSMGVAHTMRALHAWEGEPRIDVVGSDRPAFWDEQRRLPLVSFNVVVPLRRGAREHRMSAGGLEGRRKALLHPQFVAAVLSDVFGIQARAGCACAGPYGQVLLQRQLISKCGCTDEDLRAVDRHAAAGDTWVKPGWVRVYFSFLMSEAEVDYIIRAVQEVARHGHKLLPVYVMDISTGTFKHRTSSCAEVPVTTGRTVKDWLGRGNSEVHANASSTPHQFHGSEVESLQSLPRQRLDEERLCKQLQQQLHAEQSSLVADADAGTIGAARHAGVASDLTESWTRSNRSRAGQQAVLESAAVQRSVSQGSCGHCCTPSGRMRASHSSGSDMVDDRQQRQLLSQPVRNGCTRARSVSRGGPGQAQTRRSVEPEPQGQHMARPSSDTLTGACSRESQYMHGGTARKRGDGRPGGALQGESRATGRLAAAVVRSSAKVKRMNDSDRARAAIAAGKAALAASMRRRHLRSCPPC